MPLIPLELLTEIIRLLNNIIQANREDPTSTAKYVTLFWIFWPWAKPFLDDAQEKQIEALVRAIGASSTESKGTLVVPPLTPPASVESLPLPSTPKPVT